MERERELAEVGAALIEAGRGHGQVVLFEAPAGPTRVVAGVPLLPHV